MSGLSVAVTGSEAFFGRALVLALEADPAVGRVLAVDRRPEHAIGPKSTFHGLDLVHPRSPERLAALLRDTDVVVHTAFLGRPVRTGSWAHELEAIGTRHVLAAVEAANVRKLVLRSTTLVYGARPDHPNRLRETAALRGGSQSRFLRDKVEVEDQLAKFADRHPDRVVTTLRMAPLLGIGADTLASHYFGRRACPALLGHDPLVQLCHEDDAIGATVQAVKRDVRGPVNVAAPGVLPLSTAIRLAGGQPMPMPELLLRPLARTLWSASFGEYPPGLVDFLRYLCVGDLSRMRDELSYAPRLDVATALLAFGGSNRIKRLAA
jgi:UDP-glucose 4-epimerase